MFEHSVKVPRHFKAVANIVRQVSTEGGSVKTLLYDNKLRHFKTNVLYALITETVKHAADLDKLFDHCNLLQTETRLDPWLAKVLATELLFGKKTLPGKSKPEQTILSYKEQFEKYISDNQDNLRTEVAPRPRYVRINTNLLTTSDAIRAFQDEGFKFIRCTSGSYDDYLAQTQKLTEYDFTQDYHVKTIFVFAPGTKWHDHELYLENKIILQDKATAMAVQLLAPPPGSVCLDMCAAPGMKTTQLAAYLRNEGVIYAVERDEKRYQTLCDFVEKTGSSCVTTINADALTVKENYEHVEYILLDPSCSGSGMDYCLHNYKDESRIARLTSLQEKFLKHAMNAFPKAKRIIYSTCSMYAQENERVVTNAVKVSRAKWRVQDVKTLLKGQWNNIGSGMYGTIGARCMYAKPDSDFTTGFFLAVLDRDERDLAKAYRQEENVSTKNENDVGDIAENGDDKPKKKRGKDRDAVIEDSAKEDVVVDDSLTSAVSKKKKKKDKNRTDDNEGTMEVADDNLNLYKIKKKRKACNDVDLQEYSEENIQNSNNTVDNLAEDSEVSSITVKSKKKRKKDTEIELNDVQNVLDEVVLEDEVKSKKKKRKAANVSENLENLTLEDGDAIPKKKKKDKEVIETEISVNQVNEDTVKKSKKKKKSKIADDS